MLYSISSTSLHSRVIDSCYRQTTSSSYNNNIHNSIFPSNKTNERKSLPSSLSFPHTLIPLKNLATCFSTLYTNLIHPPPLPPSVDPKLVLTGNFAPVNETPPTDCPVVKGKLPPSLNGVYIRNGPNPQHEPLGAHHFFEGDGMLHSIRISNGRATFCSRYVQTYKYNVEKDAGVPLFPNFLSGFYSIHDIIRSIKTIVMIMVGHITLMQGFGLANTSVAFFFNKLFALVESDLPYNIKITQEGDIKTIKRHDFDGKVSTNMTAHPKIDPQTGEVFAFRCFIMSPYLTFFRFDSHGSKQQDVPIYSMKHPSYIHDFAITKRYVIFPDSQIEMAMRNVMACKGMPTSINTSKVTRFGVLPRYATSDSEMRWFDVPGFNAIHILNAWEEDGEEEDVIVIVAANCLYIENFFLDVEKVFLKMRVHFSLEKVKIKMKTGMVSRTVISERSLEMGTMNSSYLGIENRYAYMAICNCASRIFGVAKIDLKIDKEVSCRMYEPNCYGGEAFFVAKEDGGGTEDDGYVVSLLYNEISEESQFLVMDAKSPGLDIVATVKLPGRVPYGLHGLFVSEKNL